MNVISRVTSYSVGTMIEWFMWGSIPHTGYLTVYIKGRLLPYHGGESEVRVLGTVILTL